MLYQKWNIILYLRIFIFSMTYILLKIHIGIEIHLSIHMNNMNSTNNKNSEKNIMLKYIVIKQLRELEKSVARGGGKNWAACRVTRGIHFFFTALWVGCAAMSGSKFFWAECSCLLAFVRTSCDSHLAPVSSLILLLSVRLESEHICT